MTLVRKTAQLGEVVAAAFDKAAHYSRDPKEVSRLATQAVALILRLVRRSPPLSRWPSFFAGTCCEVGVVGRRYRLTSDE